MPAFATLLTLATAALSVSAAPVSQKAAPSTWEHKYLEDYNTYHTRYLALDCQNQHNTTFFDSCCRPLLSTESLSDRPANCTPTAEAVTSASVVANATVTDAADVAAYCSASSSVAATATPAATDADVDAASATATAEATSSIAAGANFAQGGHGRKGAASTSTSAAAAESTSSTSEEAAYTPTSTSSAAAEATTSASSGGNSGTYSGYATFYEQGGNAGACGDYHSDSDNVIAINSNGFWQNYNSGGPSEYCGKSVSITNTKNGKSVTAIVADVCPTCEGSYSIDLSVAAFNAIATEEEGMVPITWGFN
jgi:hypothetical protein